MIDSLVLIIAGAWGLLVGLGKVQVSRNPQAGAAWLARWGWAFRFGGPALILIGIVKIVVGLAR